MKDYGRYKRLRHSPQIVDVQSTVQPIRTIEMTPNIHSNNMYYRSKNLYFPMENVPQLESDASQLDTSSKGKYSVLIRNLEFCENRACKLVAINSHTDLLSSAAYLCLQQESMSVNALSRLLEAVPNQFNMLQPCQLYWP